jgi:hypothetical protein
MSGPRRWPLFLIAAPAAVSIWSGWVGLGGMCGFGLVHPLPGIVSGLRLDTAITLPVGVEAYGAYALGAWLGLPAGHPARKFARRSAIGSLVLGMLGQVAYHLLAAAHETRAPWPVVVAVSCMPVITLGFGAALTHLLRAADGELTESFSHAVPEPYPVTPEPGAPVPEVYPAAPELPASPAGEPGPDPLFSWLVTGAVPVPEPPAALNGHGHAAREMFAADLAAGEVPGIRAIRSGLNVGQDRAQQLQAYLRDLTRTPQ